MVLHYLKGSRYQKSIKQTVNGVDMAWEVAPTLVLGTGVILPSMLSDDGLLATFDAPADLLVTVGSTTSAVLLVGDVLMAAGSLVVYADYSAFLEVEIPLSVTELIVDMTGPRGPAGPEGPQGEQGLQGLPGEPGIMTKRSSESGSMHAPIVFSNTFGTATMNLSNTSITFIPFFAFETVQYNAIGLYNSTAGGTSVPQLGIYNSSLTMNPSELLVSASGYNLFTTGLRMQSIPLTTLQQGELYWLAFTSTHSGSATGSMRTYSMNTLVFDYQRIYSGSIYSSMGISKTESADLPSEINPTSVGGYGVNAAVIYLGVA